MLGYDCMLGLCLLGSEGIMASSFFMLEDKTNNTVRTLGCGLVV